MYKMETLDFNCIEITGWSRLVETAGRYFSTSPCLSLGPLARTPRIRGVSNFNGETNKKPRDESKRLISKQYYGSADPKRYAKLKRIKSSRMDKVRGGFKNLPSKTLTVEKQAARFQRKEQREREIRAR